MTADWTNLSPPFPIPYPCPYLHTEPQRLTCFLKAHMLHVCVCTCTHRQGPRSRYAAYLFLNVICGASLMHTFTYPPLPYTHGFPVFHPFIQPTLPSPSFPGHMQHIPIHPCPQLLSPFTFRHSYPSPYTHSQFPFSFPNQCQWS